MTYTTNLFGENVNNVVYESKLIPSPIKYFGSKKWLFKNIHKIIPQNTKEIFSPFMGGGSIEVNLSLNGYNVIAYDIYHPLVNFWNFFCINPPLIFRESENIIRNTTHEELSNLDQYDYINTKDFDAALWYFIFNRLSYDGRTLINTYIRPYKEEDDGRLMFIQPEGRTVLPNADIWFNIDRLDISVEKMGFDDSLKHHNDMFCYLDPPYPGNESSYGDGKNTFNHQLLAETLHKRNKWVLSYDDQSIIHELYPKNRKKHVERKTRYTATELLIFSDDLDLQTYEETLFV